MPALATLCRTPHVINPTCKFSITRVCKHDGITHAANPNRLLFDKLCAQLNISNEENWYQITPKDVIERGGGEILAHYNNSLVHTLNALYPGTQHAIPCGLYHMHMLL